MISLFDSKKELKFIYKEKSIYFKINFLFSQLIEKSLNRHEIRFNENVNKIFANSFITDFLANLLTWNMNNKNVLNILTEKN